jgi:hypothetical protein
MAETPSKLLFDNIKKLLTCLALLALATVEWKVHHEFALPPWLAAAAGLVLAGAALCLLVWSAVEGFRELGAASQWLPLALLALIYLSTVILAIHVFPSLVLRK